MFKYILIFFLFAQISLFAQNEYFQQNVDYTIHVALDDQKNYLNGFIEFEYTNNSKTTLDTIWIHLWPNAYKNDNSALAKQFLNLNETAFYNSNDEARGYIDSLDFKVDGISYTFSFHPQYNDICFLVLKNPLKTFEKIIISTPFRVKIPDSKFSRLGHSNQKYQITQWYPKPAVFDQFGWHPIPYLNKGEFYSEFGKFDVYITLPEEYVVAASGDLIDNENEIKWQKDKNHARNSKNKDSIKTKTLHYNLTKAHDFAWFVSKDFIVKQGEVILSNGHKVTTWAYYNPDSDANWKKSISFINRSLKFFSEKVGNYPYNNLTVVDGALAAGGGMEYPTITVIGNASNATSLEETVMHEIGHNWFYGILGFNERDFPWLDEGLTTFYQTEYMRLYFPKLTLFGSELPQNMISLKYPAIYEYYFSYLFSQSHGLDSRLSGHSNDFSNLNYGIIVYYKSALAFKYLQSYLGDSIFDACMKSFFDEWKFKHPQPEDFRNAFADIKGLDWFFDDIVASNKFVDYKISAVKKTKSNTYKIKINNKGRIASPINIVTFDKNNVQLDSFWIEGFKGKRKFEIPYDQRIYTIELDPKDVSLDVNYQNQTAKVKRLWSTFRTPELNFLYSIPKRGKSDLFFVPVLGFNKTNRWMPGILFYNSLLFEKKWEYRVMPMWSNVDHQLVGELGMYRNFHRISRKLYKISLGLTAKKYAFTNYREDVMRYARIAPELVFYFKPVSEVSTIKNTLSLLSPLIYLEEIKFRRFDSMHVESYKSTTNYFLLQLKYRFENKRKVNPYSGMFDVQYNKDFIKVGIDVRYRISYKKLKSGFDIRFFGGKIFNPLISNVDYSLKMSNYSGIDDYLFETNHLGRGAENGLFGQTFILHDGGFIIPTPIGRNTNWLLALNLKSNVLKTNFVKVFLNLGTYHNAKNAFNGSQQLMYEGGLVLEVIPKTIEVYLPLIYSSDIKQYLDLNDKNSLNFKIRFLLNIDAANPFKYLKELNL